MDIYIDIWIYIYIYIYTCIYIYEYIYIQIYIGCKSERVGVLQQASKVDGRGGVTYADVC